MKRLTDLEMAEVQGDKDVCLDIINGFGDCEGCSVKCGVIAQAQLDEDNRDLESLLYRIMNMCEELGGKTKLSQELKKLIYDNLPD